jgi:hypothetical protein
MSENYHNRLERTLDPRIQHGHFVRILAFRGGVLFEQPHRKKTTRERVETGVASQTALSHVGNHHRLQSRFPSRVEQSRAKKEPMGNE